MAVAFVNGRDQFGQGCSSEPLSAPADAACRLPGAVLVVCCHRHQSSDRAAMFGDRHTLALDCDMEKYARRRLVESFFCRVKESRRIATPAGSGSA